MRCGRSNLRSPCVGDRHTPLLLGIVSTPKGIASVCGVSGQIVQPAGGDSDGESCATLPQRRMVAKALQKEHTRVTVTGSWTPSIQWPSGKPPAEWVTEMVRRLISYLGVGELVGRFSGGSSTCRFIPLALILTRQPFIL